MRNVKSINKIKLSLIIILLFVITNILSSYVSAASSDVSIKSITITPGSNLNKINDTTYEVTVGVNTSSVDVEVSPNNANANVSVTRK